MALLLLFFFLNIRPTPAPSLSLPYSNTSSNFVRPNKFDLWLSWNVLFCFYNVQTAHWGIQSKDCLIRTEKNKAVSCQRELRFTICKYRRQRAEHSDTERRLRLVVLMNSLVVGDVDSIQVLCFDRLSSVFSQVGGQTGGEKGQKWITVAYCLLFSRQKKSCCDLWKARENKWTHWFF